jgi:hypothetical protein
MGNIYIDWEMKRSNEYQVAYIAPIENADLGAKAWQYFKFFLPLIFKLENWVPMKKKVIQISAAQIKFTSPIPS